MHFDDRSPLFDLQKRNIETLATVRNFTRATLPPKKELLPKYVFIGVIPSYPVVRHIALLRSCF